MQAYFFFDVESVGLHGEGFAVAGGVYLANGAAQWEFLYACPESEAKGNTDDRQGFGPYPLHEIATYMAAAGMNPMAIYEREASEMPPHDPLADARLSARLLSQALGILKRADK